MLRRIGRLHGGEPTPAETWRKGALMGAAHIGDVLYCTGSLPALRETLPKCEWYFVAPIAVAEVLENNPHVAGCVPNLQSLLVSKRVDVAVCYNSSMYWRDIAAVTRFGIPNRAGYTHKGLSGLVTLPIAINYPQPYPSYFRDLVAQLTGRSPTWSLRPIIYPDKQDQWAADNVWNAEKLNPAKQVIACFATSRQTSGVWPARKFAETLVQIEGSGDYQTVLCGSAADEPVLEELKQDFKLRAAIIAGRLNLRALGCFLRRCSAVLCPDSGPRHIANAMNTPVFFVRNIAVGRIETGEYVHTETDLAPPCENIPLAKQEEIFPLLNPSRVAETIISSLSGPEMKSIADPFER